jgi:hypothetical protein
MNQHHPQTLGFWKKEEMKNQSCFFVEKESRKELFYVCPRVIRKPFFGKSQLNKIE